MIMMMIMIFIYAVAIYMLCIDWAYLYPENKIAYAIELTIFFILLPYLGYLYYELPEFYGKGRKIDVLLLMWLSRELIHTRVKFNRTRKEMTTLVSNRAVESAQNLW